MKWLYLVAILLLFAGCGDVNWFPDSTSSSTPTTPSSGGTSGNADAPNAFEFAPKTISVFEANGNVVQSDAVTITGDNPNGWTVSTADSPASTNSDVIINNKYFLHGSTLPKILPGETIQIVQTPSLVVGQKVSTTVTIGTKTAEFVTTTTN